jgi:signal transduction histidine kinase
MARRKDGTLFPVELETRSVKNEQEKFRVVAIRDITERVKEQKKKEVLEAQLRQSQKLESVGTLASGVAHEINNPLTGIINCADLIGSRTDSVQLKEFANAIVKEGNRVSAIVKGLLSFARQDKQGHSAARMQDIVDGVLAITKATLRKDKIEIQLEIAPNLPQVSCRSQQIQQVILNLLTNARDALNQRHKGSAEEKVIKISIYQYENDGIAWVRTTIKDNGIGIPKDAMDKIFDPFFTTKPRDKGTGLGLSVSYGIVQEHRGKLTAESKPGKYTRFHLDLRANDS